MFQLLIISVIDTKDMPYENLFSYELHSGFKLFYNIKEKSVFAPAIDLFAKIKLPSFFGKRTVPAQNATATETANPALSETANPALTETSTATATATANSNPARDRAASDSDGGSAITFKKLKAIKKKTTKKSKKHFKRSRKSRKIKKRR